MSVYGPLAPSVAGPIDHPAVAVAQTVPVACDVDANLAAHRRLAELAASEGAQLLLFPELSLTGYELGRARDLAFSEDDPRLSSLRAAAAKRSITLIVGAPVRLGRSLHIAALILSPDGRAEFYTKRHLGAFSAGARRDGTVPPAEATVFRPGDRDPIVRVGDRSAAMAICADTGHASHPQRAADRGADIYLASMFVIPSDLEADLARLQGYATRHGMMVALANFGGPSGGLAAAGRSSIWSADGELLVRLGAKGAGVAIVAASPEGWGARTIRVDG